MTEKESKRASKFLSLVLRHKPETIGLILDENGWADVKDLIEKLHQHNLSISENALADIVSTNNKQRFAFNADQTKIRANQGHSVAVDLQLKEADPPEYLYHGTGEKNVSSILNAGIIKGSRQHVHLSQDMETAITVGQRHGKPKVFLVSSGKMKTEGFTFYLSDNLVWLTNHVPAAYVELVK
jgi:putative RNA 2'-phosphotransferase